MEMFRSHNMTYTHTDGHSILWLRIPDIAFARYLIIENFVVMADRIDEKTCTGHGIKSTVRTGYQCIVS